jgi:hypothetical protein
MKYASKINLNLGVDVQDILRRTRIMARHGLGNAEVQLTRRFVSKKMIARIKQSLPAALIPHIQGIHLTESQALPVHVHTKDFSVINFYDSVNGEATDFWEGNTEALNMFDDNGNLYLTVNPENLIWTESFTASPGDVWLLNTRQPHSITAINNSNTRTMLQIFLGIPFDEVLKHVHTSTSNHSTSSTH